MRRPVHTAALAESRGRAAPAGIRSRPATRSGRLDVRLELCYLRLREAYGYVGCLHLLLQAQKLAPPSVGECVESFTRRRADGKKSERIWRFDRRRVGLAEEIHFGEDDAVRFGRELG